MKTLVKSLKDRRDYFLIVGSRYPTKFEKLSNDNNQMLK